MKKQILLAITTLSLSLSAPAQGPLNPPAPVLKELQRDHKHVEVYFWYKGPVDGFQLMRRTTNNVGNLSRYVGPERCAIVNEDEGRLFTFVDKKDLKDGPYTYTVIVFVNDGTSQESNALTINLNK